MIPQTNESEKVYEELSCQFIRAIKELKISHVLSQCNTVRTAETQEDRKTLKNAQLLKYSNF